jgi:hypothetical protein
MKQRSYDTAGQAGELISYGHWLVKTFTDLGWFGEKGVTKRELDGYRRDFKDQLQACSVQSIRTSLSLLNNCHQLGNGYWVIPAEHAHTFWGMAPPRLASIERAMKYALLTDVTPVLVIPPLFASNSTEDETLRIAIFEQFEKWKSTRKQVDDPDFIYLRNVLTWLEPIRDLVIDGVILLSPSTPMHEINRAPFSGDLVDDKEFSSILKSINESKSSEIGRFVLTSENLRKLAPQIPDWLAEGSVTPWYNVPPRLVGALCADVLDQIQPDLEVIKKKYCLSERECRLLTDPNYAAPWVVWGWMHKLGTDLLRSVSESVIFNSSPFLSGKFDAQFLSRLLGYELHDLQLCNTPIDIGTIEIPGIDEINIVDAAKLKTRFPISCAALGLAIEGVREELFSIPDPIERSRRQRLLQRKVIAEPLGEVQANVKNANVQFAREAPTRAGGVAFGGGGFTISSLLGQPSLKIVSSLISSLAIGALGETWLSYIKTKDTLKIMPSYVIYEVWKHSTR